MRGLIVTSEALGFHRGKLTLPWPHIDLDMLKYWSLYWDQIDWPIDNVWKIGWQPEHEIEMYADTDMVSDIVFLYEAGVFCRSKLNYVTSNPPEVEIAYNAPLAAFKKHERTEPGMWSLSQTVTENALRVFPNRAVDTLRVSILDSLPVPNARTPLNDVLEFKEQHRDELTEFWSYFDEMYQDIRRAPDRPLAERASVERMEMAIGNAIKLAREHNKISFGRASLTASFSLTTAAIAGTSALSLGGSLGMAVLAGAAAGGVISVSKGVGLNVGVNRDNPLEYITSFVKTQI